MADPEIGRRWRGGEEVKTWLLSVDWVTEWWNHFHHQTTAVAPTGAELRRRCTAVQRSRWWHSWRCCGLHSAAYPSHGPWTCRLAADDSQSHTTSYGLHPVIRVFRIHRKLLFISQRPDPASQMAAVLSICYRPHVNSDCEITLICTQNKRIKYSCSRWLNNSRLKGHIVQKGQWMN